MDEGFPKIPVTPPEPDDSSVDKENEEVQGIQEKLTQNEGVELTLEEKYKIVGKKDSILTQRGIQMSIGYLDELLAQGVVITNRNDFEAIADAVMKKFEEVRGNNVAEAMSSEEIKAKKLVIETFIKTYGFEDVHSKELMDDWVRESEKWVTAEGTPRANIIHNLRIMDLLRAGGKMDEAVEAARDAYRMATIHEYWDIVDDILDEFPEFAYKIDVEGYLKFRTDKSE